MLHSITYNHFYTSPSVFATSCVYQVTPSRITWRRPWLFDASQMSQLSAWRNCRLPEQKKKVKRRAVVTKFRPSQWELQLSVDVVPGAKQKSRRSIMRETGKTTVFFVCPTSSSLHWVHPLMNSPTTCVSVVCFLLSQHVLSSVSYQFAHRTLSQ